jgi:RNA recognition motif. (a.k.a. RRM, RBD, or RNP domain)
LCDLQPKKKNTPGKGARVQKTVAMVTGGGAANKNKQKKNRNARKSGQGVPAPIVIPLQGPKGRRSGRNKRVKDPERVNPDLRQDRLEGNAGWKHDMSKYGAGKPPRGPREPSLVGTKLFISNLDYNVSNADIKELFETIGPLVSHRVHYQQKTGRSEGTGEVVFADRAKAVLAQKKYHSIELDGRPMNITLIEQRTQPERTLKSGIKISAGPGRVISVPRGAGQAFNQAFSQPTRGRGKVRSKVESMQMD